MKRVIKAYRRLAGKFSQHRTLIFLVYMTMLGLVLPAFYPDAQKFTVSTHNGFLLGLAILGFIFLAILDATALYDDDLLDKFADAWIDLSEENQRRVTDFAHATLDAQIEGDKK